MALTFSLRALQSQWKQSSTRHATKSGLFLVKPLEELTQTYISKDIPVIVWATMDMNPSRPGFSRVIDYADESSPYKAGDTYTWPVGEHCLVLVGYDKENYYFNAPYKNYGIKPHQRFEELGSQALVLTEKKQITI